MELGGKWVDYDESFIQRRYDRLARFFGFFEWLFLPPPGIRSKAVNRLELRRGSRVLEVGCGTGRNLSQLVQAVGPEGHVYGVDLSEGMLAKGKLLADEADRRNVTLIHSADTQRRQRVRSASAC